MKTNRYIVINGITKTASLVPVYKQKDIRFCKKNKCNYLAIRIEYKGNKLKAFWVKTKGSETWKMLVSTDTDITFTNAMKYYQIRWSIEVFFKECKQNLNINKCQSTDFDAHIAWITLTHIARQPEGMRAYTRLSGFRSFCLCTTDFILVKGRCLMPRVSNNCFNFCSGREHFFTDISCSALL